ncbi:hypothetical protein [Citrobacter telavivensis]|uniref:hypothetical protein n=1 Tax=Citrobacter telavivensis TaxID=2653932 RepID=UPI00359D61D0
MNRELEILIDQNTWPKKNKLPHFPKSFHNGSIIDNINIPSMLLMIGYLTTPTSSTGVSLSEFWAWIRYLSAVTNDKDMRLTDSFYALDAHQKTILSDDFGMGVPMLWLMSSLSLNQIVDGNYFIQKIAASVNAKSVRTGKRGPNKTPDFVAKDHYGDWHVIECKGTQSGPEYSDKQLGIKGKKGTGGIVQKKSIVFPTGHTGQRLACGLSIGIENRSSSLLKIVDPEPDEPFEVDEQNMIYAEDAITRGAISKYLRLSGLEITAERIAAPLGRTPDVNRYKSRTAESHRVEWVKEREQRSYFELRQFLDTQKIKKHFNGRERVIELPRSVVVDDKIISKVIIRQEINNEAIEDLLIRQYNDGPIVESFAYRLATARRNRIMSTEFASRLNFGEIFQSEIILSR